MTQAEFNEYYRENYRPIKGFIRKRVRNDDADAEDITQEVFLIFYRLADVRKKPVAYLYRIAKTQIIDFYRRNKNKRKFEVNGFDFEQTGVTMPDTTWMLSEYPLSPAMKLRLEGYKFREIAEKLNIHPGTVRSRLHYERTQLKKVMQ